MSFGFGDSADLSVVGDWDGDGIATPGVFRNGAWYLRNSNSTGIPDLSFGFGDPGDVPVVGDWDGDGIATPGVFRNGIWYLRSSSRGGTADTTFAYGDLRDRPLTYASDPSSTVVSSALSPFAADYYSFVGGPNRVVVSAPATLFSLTPDVFERTLTALNGTWSTQSRLPRFRSAIIESEFV